MKPQKAKHGRRIYPIVNGPNIVELSTPVRKKYGGKDGYNDRKKIGHLPAARKNLDGGGGVKTGFAPFIEHEKRPG